MSRSLWKILTILVAIPALAILSIGHIFSRRYFFTDTLDDWIAWWQRKSPDQCESIRDNWFVRASRKIERPFKWLGRWRHFIWDKIDDVRIGICNVIRWAPVIWRDQDFDSDALMHVMEYKLRRLARVLKNGHLVNGDRYGKQCLVCAELLRRLMDDEYFNNAGHNLETWDSLPDHRRQWIANHANEMAKNDMAYLGKLMGKYLTHWWD